MPSKKDIAVVCAIGIDTGKNTLHMITCARNARCSQLMDLS